MKSIIVSIVLSFVYFVSFAQKETSQWYFGLHNAFDFNTSPVTFFTNKGSTYSCGNTASLSDENGNLLFYTDGQIVWNREHQTMPNGTGLKGHGRTEGQKCLIVSSGAGKKKLYYIFTSDGPWYDIDKICCFPNDSVFAYSIVDMEKDGGKGDVIVKNVVLTSPVQNSVVGVKHSNGIDTWVLTHRLFTNEFYAYLVTECGVQPPVVSSVGLVELNWFPPNLAFSPDGNKLSYYAGTISSNIQYIFDFDNTLGIVSNPVSLANKTGPEGCSFSPNSRFIYISSLFGNFDQFDLEAADIPNSRRTLKLQMDGMQLGLDGKLYIADEENSFIHVLNNVDQLLDSANFEYMKYKVNGQLPSYANSSLPNFIASYFDPSYKSPIQPDFEAKRVCVNEISKFVLNTNRFSSSLINAQWDFGDGQKSAILNPASLTDTISHTYSRAGKYNVKLILNYICKTDEIQKEIIVDSIPSIELGNDKKICDGSMEKLSVPSGFISYNWNDGSSDSSVFASKPGVYYVTVTNTCGKAEDSIELLQRTLFIPNLTTPNGDGKNDNLVIEGIDKETGALSVYNRWGTLIYKNNSYTSDWGNNMEEGVYYYNFKFQTCPEIKGWLQVIK